MRKIIIITILIQANCLIYGQNEWAPKGAEWYYCNPKLTSNPFYDYDKYVSNRDTIIEGKTCRIIESDTQQEIMYSEENKVYYYFKNKFNLIYDFQAKKGDTVDFNFKSYKQNSLSTETDTFYTAKCFVDKIDTISVGGVKLRKFQTSIIKRDDLDFIVWDSKYIYIERIGYDYGFIYLLSIPSIGLLNNLRCYIENDINYTTDWWAGQDKECDYRLATTVDETKSELENPHFFYNSNDNSITFELPYEKNETYKVKIHDNLGKIVHDSTLQIDQSKIDLPSLPKGNYYVTISSNESFFKPFKIIKL